MLDTEPAAEFEAWRCVWSALGGTPVPVITGNAQAVLEALAGITATTLAARSGRKMAQCWRSAMRKTGCRDSSWPTSSPRRRARLRSNLPFAPVF